MSTNENSLTDDQINSEDKELKNDNENKTENTESDNENKTEESENKSESEDENKSEESEESDNENKSEDEMLLSVNFSVKDNSELFVLSIDGVPNFYTKNVKDARTLMWNYAKSRRIQETQYNTYIRGCPDKNRIELVGTHKYSVFFVDRVICSLLISSIKELEKFENETPSLPKIQTPPKVNSKVNSPQKTGFFSNFFW
jgi:hypothetical protein